MQDKTYRRLKRRLNKYYQFSFNLPPSHKSLSSSQKRTIRRVYNRLYRYINRVEDHQASFIRKEKGISPDRILKKTAGGVKTNKGVFYYLPCASIKKLSKSRLPDFQLIINERHITELYFPFPVKTRGDMEKIEVFINQLIVKYDPSYIMWGVYGYQSPRGRYEPSLFFSYKPILDDSKEDGGREGLSGVFLGFEQGKKMKPPKKKPKKIKRKKKAKKKQIVRK